ncbi:hypothetical protein N7454_000199 [Penicillium verhagenii]|nr:hypothetical protein N7454_000199 [Penicillium verhagenii]
MSKLIDKTKNEPEKGASGAQNWLALSKKVASWIYAHVTHEIVEKCEKTGKRILLATEMWDVLETVMVSIGVFALPKLFGELSDMKPEYFPKPSIYAVKMLVSYGKIRAIFKDGIAPFTVLILMLGQIGNTNITFSVLKGLEARNKLYHHFTNDDLVREVGYIVASL